MSVISSEGGRLVSLKLKRFQNMGLNDYSFEDLLGCFLYNMLFWDVLSESGLQFFWTCWVACKQHWMWMNAVQRPWSQLNAKLQKEMLVLAKYCSEGLFKGQKQNTEKLSEQEAQGASCEPFFCQMPWAHRPCPGVWAAWTHSVPTCLGQSIQKNSWNVVTKCYCSGSKSHVHTMVLLTSWPQMQTHSHPQLPKLG